jgi:hypothetical protein
VPVTATNRSNGTQMAGRADSAGSAVVFAIFRCIRRVANLRTERVLAVVAFQNWKGLANRISSKQAIATVSTRGI